LSYRVDYWDTEFDRVIARAGESVEGVFYDLALKFYGNEALREPYAALAVGGIMARSGLLLCECRDPLAYFEFLQCVSHRVRLEMDRVVGSTTFGGPHIAAVEAVLQCPFMDFANKTLDREPDAAPLSLSWAMIADGLQLCETIESNYYPNLVSGLLDLIVNVEGPRVESWPRRIIETVT
jgi:hypothetical protein